MPSVEKSQTNMVLEQDLGQAKPVKAAAKKYALSVVWILVLAIIGSIVGNLSLITEYTLFGLGIEETSIVAMATVVIVFASLEQVWKRMLKQRLLQYRDRKKMDQFLHAFGTVLQAERMKLEEEGKKVDKSGEQFRRWEKLTEQVKKLRSRISNRA